MKSIKYTFLSAFFILSINALFSQEIKPQWQKKGKVHTERSWAQLMNDPTVNFYDVQATFYDWYEKAKPKHGIGPYKRWEAFMEPRVYPSGDRTKITDPFSELKKFKKKYAANKSTNGNWSLIGPTFIEGEIQNGQYMSPGGNGRINCIVFDPNFDGNNNQTLWVGTPAGGLWKTENNGKTWSSPGVISIGVSEIIIDPDNNQNMWIGTGDNDAGDTYSSGILSSVDGGQTWNATSFAVNQTQKYRVRRLLASPANVNTQIAFCNGVTYRTTDGWNNHVTINSLGNDNIDDAEFKPGTNGTTVYASKTNANAAELWRSADGGVTFVQVGAGLPNANVERISIAVSPAQPDYVWALVGRDDNQGLLGIYRSTDSGANFVRLYDGTVANHNLLGWNTDFSDAGGQAFYDLSIQVNPSDANDVFVGGVNFSKSTDSGSNWTCVGYWLKNKPGYEYIHADHHAIEYAPNGWVYDGCDGGVFVSKNNGTNWTDISNNLGIAQVARMGASSTNPRLVLAGMQDNGSNKFSNETWEVIKGGDGCEQIIDPNDNDVIFSSYVQGKIYRSTDRGSTWNTVLDAGGGWITPFVMDPTNHNIMYSGSYTAGSKKIQKSTDNGVNWNAAASYNPAAATWPKWISVSQSDNSYVYIVSSDQVWRSTNSGVSMSGRNGDLFGAPNNVTASISSIEVAPDDKDYIVITLSGYNAGEKVFRSTNGGTNWTNISSNLPNLPVNVVVFEEGNANKRIYVGTDNGVYYKDATNANGNWTLFDTGLPQTSIYDMEIYYGANFCENRLRAATYGRSIWETDLPGGGVLAYNSSTVIQPNTTDVNLGTVSQEIIGIKVTMTNCGDPVSITDFQLNTNGTTNAANDIENARIYYTGSVASFQPIQQFGNTVANPNGSFTISGSRNLVGGDNYFWLAYDIKPSATSGNFVDGECSRITINGTNYTPTTTAPAGHRKIITCTNCTVSSSSDDATGITNVTFNTINENSQGDPAYTDNTAISTDVTIGNSYNLSIKVNTAGNYTVHAKAWIDWNHNCDFTDAGEEYDLGSVTNVANGATSLSPNINIPAGAFGNTIMRIRATYDVAPVPCDNQNWSEAEDYTLKIQSAISWDGSKSSDWQDTENWTPEQIPTNTDNITIPNGCTHYPIINNGIATIAECNNITIENNASLTIDPDGYMTVSGSITNNAGTGGLVINSNNTGTGSLIQNSASGVDATVNTYLAASPQQWHMVGSPVASAPVSVFPTTNNLYFYDESVDDYWTGANFGSQQSGWTDFNSGNMSLNKGYLFNYYATTLNYTGQLNPNTTTNSITITYNDHGVNAPNGNNYNDFDGWNFISNPYTSAIDWDNAGINHAAANLDDAVYFYDGVNSQYASWVGGVSTNGGSQYIPAGQGFFVKANASGTLNIPAGALTHNTKTYWKNTLITDNLLKLKIEHSGFSDETAVRLKEDATFDFDNMFDAYKRFSWNDDIIQLFTFNPENKTEYAINTVCENNQVIIPLAYKVNSNDVFSVYVNEYNFDDYKVFLHDIKDEIQTELSLGKEYLFNSEAGTFKNRFEIIFKKSNSGNINTFNKRKINIYPNPSNGYFNINIINNFEKYRIEISTVTGKNIYKSGIINEKNYLLDLRNYKSGVYFIKLKFLTDYSEIYNKIIIK